MDNHFNLHWALGLLQSPPYGMGTSPPQRLRLHQKCWPLDGSHIKWNGSNSGFDAGPSHIKRWTLISSRHSLPNQPRVGVHVVVVSFAPSQLVIKASARLSEAQLLSLYDRSPCPVSTQSASASWGSVQTNLIGCPVTSTRKWFQFECQDLLHDNVERVFVWNARRFNAPFASSHRLWMSFRRVKTLRRIQCGHNSSSRCLAQDVVHVVTLINRWELSFFWREMFVLSGQKQATFIFSTQLLPWIIKLGLTFRLDS